MRSKKYRVRFAAKPESYSLNPDELEEMRERIGLLQSLCAQIWRQNRSRCRERLWCRPRKSEGLSQKAKNELTGIELSSGEEARLRSEIETLNAQMKDKALYLSEKRRLASLELEQKVQQELKALGMEETQIKVSIRWEYADDGTVTQANSPKRNTLCRRQGSTSSNF